MAPAEIIVKIDASELTEALAEIGRTFTELINQIELLGQTLNEHGRRLSDLENQT